MNPGPRRTGRTTAATLLAIAACLLAANLVFDAGDLAPPAYGEDKPTFGNTGGQRERIVELQKETNRKLDQLIALLKSGQAKVQLARPEKDKERPGHVDSTKKTP